MDRKKFISYIILGSVVLLLFVTIGFSMILRNDSNSSPIVTTKLRAALLTYKRTVVINGATPTPVGNGGLPTSFPTSANQSSGSTTISGNPAPTTRQSSGSSQSSSSSSTTSTPPPSSPTDTVIYNNGETVVDTSASEAPTEPPTGSDTETPIETISGDVSPTKTESLPQTGTVQYPIILFISATVFLFISFLF